MIGKSLLAYWLLVNFTPPLHTDPGDIQIAEIKVFKGASFVVPIGVIRSGKLVDPGIYDGKHTEKEIASFFDHSYANGTRFFARHRGTAAGELEITGQPEGCDSDFEFTARWVQGQPHADGSFELAISRTSVASHRSLRLLVSPDVQSLFPQIIRENLNKSLPSLTDRAPVTIHSLVATRASASGNPLLVGSVSFRSRRSEIWVFAIVEQLRGQWHLQLSQVHETKDLVDHKDAQQENYLDQLDIDGDGVDELFTDFTYYEGYSFSAYKLENGVWTKVYASAPAGC